MSDSPEQYEILDRQEDSNGDVQSYLLHWKESGRTERKAATPTNKLLIDEGLYDFLNNSEAIKVNEDPEIIVSSRSNEHSYLLRVDGDVVETTPHMSQDVLEGIDAAIDGNERHLLDVYQEIRANHVRQDVINALVHIFGEDRHRIQRVANGWLIDGFFVITWDAGLYSTQRGPEEDTMVRQGQEVVEADSSHEFVELDLTNGIESEEVTLDGDKYLLTEREMLFLAKAEWVLNGPKYHPNKSYWMDLHYNYTDLDIENLT
jgi:hypothetical protein